MQAGTLDSMLTLLTPDAPVRPTYEEALEELVSSVTDEELDALLAEARERSR